MFKKSKIKFFRLLFIKKTLIVAALVAVGASFLVPQKIEASSPTGTPNYKKDGMTFTVDTLVNGQAGNYIKAVKGQPIKFSVGITINRLINSDDSAHEVAQDSLNTGTDTYDFETTSGGRYKILAIGAGLIDTSNTTVCSSQTVHSWLGIGSTSNLMTCDFADDLKKAISENPIQINKQYTIDFSVDVSNFSLDKPCTWDKGAVKEGCVGVFQYIGLDSSRVDQMVPNTLGKAVYVSVFDTQALADAATKPADIPGYGSRTGTTDNSAGGNTIIALLNKVIGALLGLIQEFIYLVFYWLLAPMIQAMLNIRTYTDTFVGVIYPGWIIVRNACNIMFIVAIIAIAMGTLFRVESYQYKHLLVQLLIAALLVNFSLVIAQAILGLADTVQNQFLPNNVEVIRALAKDLMVGYRTTVYNTDFSTSGYFSDTLQPLFYLALALGSFGVFAAIAIFLVIRIVALWIYLLLSPIAYVAGVLPPTAKYRTEWWSGFIKYAFFTPIIAFFLNIAAVMASKQQTNPVLAQINNDPTLGGSSLAAFVFKVSSNILLLVFLIAALQVAEKLGIYGGAAVGEWGKKGMFAPFAAAGFGAKALGGKIGQSYSKFTTRKLTANQAKDNKVRAALWRGAGLLNPKVAKEAWKARAHEKEEEAYLPAIGHARDTINRAIPTEWKWEKGIPRSLGIKTYYGRIGQQQMISKKEKEWENADLSEEEKVAAYMGVRHPEDKEAIRRLLIRGRHEDGLQITMGLLAREEATKGLTEKYIGEGMNPDMARKRAEQEAASLHPAEYDSVEDLMSAVKDFHGLTQEQIGDILAHMDELGEADTKLRAIGNAYYDWDEKFRPSSDTSGYQKLEAARGSGAMLTELSGLDLWDDVEMENVVDKSGSQIFTKAQKGERQDADHNLLDESGNKVPLQKVKALTFKEKDELGNVKKDSAGNEIKHTVTNFAEFEKAIDETSDHTNSSGNNFHYEYTGARKQQSAQKRVDRGDSEKWGAALEPAAFMVQTPEGFTRFSSYGKRLFKQYSPANINSFKKSRRLQARIIKAAGLTKNAKTGEIVIADKVDSTGRVVQQGIGEDKLELMRQGLTLNADLENAIIERAELDNTGIGELETKMNDYLSKIGKTMRVAADSTGGKNSLKITTP